MTGVNWGLAQTPQAGFQNALAMGMQMGAQARQAREAREYRNALAQFDPTNPDTLKPIMEIRPDVGMQLRGQVQKEQAARVEGELVSRALAGDDEALTQLATVNFDTWKTLDKSQKDAVANEAAMIGNAALDVLNKAPEERAQAVMAYAQQMQDPKIAEIAQLPPDQLEAALRSAVAEAKMTEKLIAMERPQSFNVGPGEGRYERDPRTGEISTIIAPNYGQAQPFAPVQGESSGPSSVQGRQTMDMGHIRGMINGLGLEGAKRQIRQLSDGGVLFQISTPQEANMLPPGTRYVTPNGEEYIR